MEQLRATQKAAFAAWQAAPTAATEAALHAATAAVAAAKRAVAPAPAQIDNAAIAAVLGRGKRIAADNAVIRETNRAVRLYEQAMEWPRCGQNWGMYPGEAAAARIVDAMDVA